MRLLMYRGPGGPTPGVLEGEEVIGLQSLAETTGNRAFPDLLSLIDLGEEGVTHVQAMLQQAGSRSPRLNLRDVDLLPPLDPPRGNVLAIGHNYSAHAEELARARGLDDVPPTVFTKAQTTITGPYDDVPIDSKISSMFDWEVELGVVLGRRGRNIPREHALDYVFGYTVVNDITARDMQYGWGGQYFKGKSLDGSCPLGPWIVTRDEIPDPHNLTLSLKVNGVIKQEGNTSGMIHRIDELIAMLSLGMTLLPGSLIATGTPPGVGFARTPKESLQPGDVMESEVEGIGLLLNRMVPAAT